MVGDQFVCLLLVISEHLYIFAAVGGCCRHVGYIFVSLLKVIIAEVGCCLLFFAP